MADDPYFCALHHAVIEDDLDLVKELARDPLLRRVRNAAGFTPLELARYLGHQQCVALLSANKKRLVHAFLKEEPCLFKLTEEQFQRRLGATYCSQLLFESYDALLKVQENCPWLIKNTFLGNDSHELACKFQFQIDDGYVAPVSIRWIDEILGYGVFADIDLPAGSFVGEFTGVVRQLSRTHPDHNEYCFHYPTRFFSWHYYVVDAQYIGNEMRFVNHSDQPNLQPYSACSHALLHTIFLTNSDISAGTQLTYNYGRDFWRRRPKQVNLVGIRVNIQQEQAQLCGRIPN